MDRRRNGQDGPTEWTYDYLLTSVPNIATWAIPLTVAASAVEVHADHACALLADEKTYCWGDGDANVAPFLRSAQARRRADSRRLGVRQGWTWRVSLGHFSIGRMTFPTTHICFRRCRGRRKEE